MFLEVCLGTIYWSTSTRPGPVTFVKTGIECPTLTAVQLPAHSFLFDILLIFPCIVSLWCWKLAFCQLLDILLLSMCKVALGTSLWSLFVPVFLSSYSNTSFIDRCSVVLFCVNSIADIPKMFVIRAQLSKIDFCSFFFDKFER